MPYAHAPITEALIDIQATGIECSLEELRSFADLGANTTEVREIRWNQFVIRPGQPAPVHQTNEVAGFQFWGPDRRWVWQARSNGFTFSHLTPYNNWRALASEARFIWTKFRSQTGAIPSRMAVRYINRFDLPITGDFADYFLTVPRIPPKLDTGLAGYLMQLVLPQRDLEAVAVITQTPMAPPRPDFASVILDIDLYRDKNVPQDEGKLWDLFEEFRNRKNFLFEESISNKAREVIR